MKLAPLLLLLVLGAPGCVLTSATLALSEDRAARQTARLEEGQVRLESDDERRTHALPAGVDAGQHRLAGGPTPHLHPCLHTGWGLVDATEPTPFALEEARADGTWGPTRLSYGPIVEPGARWVGALLPLTLALDLALLPLEVAFVGVVLATEDAPPPPFAVQVTRDEVLVRAGPGPDALALGRAARGQRFVVDPSDDARGWWIDWGDRRGWLPAADAARVPADAVRLSASVAVRVGPSETARPIGATGDGRRHARLRQEGSWLLVQFDDRTGWVPAGPALHLALR
jgi:hypothetical protein